MAFVPGISKDLIRNFVVNRSSVAITKVDNLFVGYIKGDIFKSNFYYVVQLFRGGDEMILEGDGGGHYVRVEGNARF